MAELVRRDSLARVSRNTKKVDEVDSRIINFLEQLRRKQIWGSYKVSLETLSIIRLLIRTRHWVTAAELIRLLKQLAARLSHPTELCIANIIRRVLWMVRDEYQRCLQEASLGEGCAPTAEFYPSLYESEPSDSYDCPVDLQARILTAVDFFHDEMTELYKSIADQAYEHIHANEIIMSVGVSKTVAEFFRSASRKRSFDVIVCETSPENTGHDAAVCFADFGIRTTLVTDSAIFAMMGRVNKVVIGTHAVMANGGLIARSGTYAVCLAAKMHQVPVLVLTGLYKLSSHFPREGSAVFEFGKGEMLGPQNVITFASAEDTEFLDVKYPAYDYIPPEFVTLYITNAGGHAPTYVYRLLSDYYHRSDLNI